MMEEREMQVEIEDQKDALPDGKVRTVDGKIIDRAKACFLLQQHPEHKDIFRATDNTIYHRSEAGTLRRLNNKKLSKREKKASKKMRHNAPQPPLDLRGGEEKQERA